MIKVQCQRCKQHRTIKSKKESAENYQKRRPLCGACRLRLKQGIWHKTRD